MRRPPGAVRRFLIQNTTTPTRFILVWGVLFFGGSMAVTTFVQEFPDMKCRDIVPAIIFRLVVFPIIGALWGGGMWLLVLLLRWLGRRSAKAAEKQDP